MLFYLISGITLLVVNPSFSKILQNSKILRPRLSDNFSFFSTFLIMIPVCEGNPILAQKGWFYSKKHHQTKLKAFQNTF